MVTVLYIPDVCQEERAKELLKLQCPNIDCRAFLVFEESDIQKGFEQRDYEKYISCPKCGCQIDSRHAENLTTRDYVEHLKGGKTSKTRVDVLVLRNEEVFDQVEIDTTHEFDIGPAYTQRWNTLHGPGPTKLLAAAIERGEITFKILRISLHPEGTLVFKFSHTPPR